jgi:hypothetical protein
MQDAEAQAECSMASQNYDKDRVGSKLLGAGKEVLEKYQSPATTRSNAQITHNERPYAFTAIAAEW